MNVVGQLLNIESLKNHPTHSGYYQQLANKNIEDIDTSLYEGMKTAPNPIADIFRAGANAYVETRLMGQSPVKGLLQAVISSVGEGTGIGADRIRGLDVRKPLDQMRADHGGSWADWFRPIPVFWGGKVKDVRAKAAAERGERYTPDPTTQSEIYVGDQPTGVTYEQALDATQAKIRTEQPPKLAPVQQNIESTPDIEEET